MTPGLLAGDAGFPLTDVALSPSVAIVSGHDVEGTDWAAFRGIATLIILMAGKTLGDIAQRLIAIGWQSDTPVAVIKAAGTPKQQQWQTRLSEAGALAQQHALSPSIVVIGRITTS